MRDQYTEIQIGAGFTAWNPESPPCDNCRSKRKNGSVPIVYSCRECIRHHTRPLCRKCASKEFSDDSALHKIDHRVRKWQPTWEFDFGAGMYIELVNPRMEDFVNGQLPDDIRDLEFVSRDFFDDRAIRCFLPSPGGPCRIIIEVQVHPIKSEKRHRDLMERAKGVFKDHGLSEVAGAIGVSAYPFTLTAPPMPHRKAIPSEARELFSDNRFASSMTTELKRDDNFRKPYFLEIYVNTGWGSNTGVELMLQDESYESNQFRDIPFKWNLKRIR